MKCKVEILYTVTYEIDSESCPAGCTPEECLEIDLTRFRDDPESLFVQDLGDAKEDIKGRIIDVIA